MSGGINDSTSESSRTAPPSHDPSYEGPKAYSKRATHPNYTGKIRNPDDIYYSMYKDASKEKQEELYECPILGPNGDMRYGSRKDKAMYLRVDQKSGQVLYPGWWADAVERDGG